MEYKILYIPPSGTTQHCQHSWVSHSNDICVGHIHMQVEANERIKFLDAWVHSEYRRKGIYRSLWETRWEYVQNEYKGYIVYAWCKPMSLPLLLEKGFEKGEECVYVERVVADDDPPNGPYCPVTC